MKYVRNSAGFEEEGKSRVTAKQENESIKKLRDTYFIPIERLQKESEFLSSMMARREVCMSHFGEDAERAFSLFSEAVHSVRIASGMLIQMANDGPERDREFSEKLRCDIWEPVAVVSKANVVGDKIEEGLKLIEDFCKPVFQLSDKL